MKSQRIIVNAVVLLVIIGVLITWLWSGLPSAHDAAARNQCYENLKGLLIGLDAYIDSHSTLPINAKGKFSLNVLIDHDRGLLQADHYIPCRDQPLHLNYIVNPCLHLEDIRYEGTELPVIIACDTPGNHPLYNNFGFRKWKNGHPQEFACLLLADGSLTFWQGDSDAYREWAKVFADGKGEQYPPGFEDGYPKRTPK